MFSSRPRETEEQRQQRQIAERENRQAMMGAAADRTRSFSRYMRPRISIATGQTIPVRQTL